MLGADDIADGISRRLQLVQNAGGCQHPVRLHGRIIAEDRATGEQRQMYSTEDEPGGVVLLPCNNRRASVCEPCSTRYRYDTYHLTAAGLRGGKTVPDTVAEHPRVFLTLTAPGCGLVHGVRATRTGRDRDGNPTYRYERCRPRAKTRPVCPHGQPAWCTRRHRPDDPEVGTPLCVGCFDYRTAVLWNHFVPELWRRFTIALRRELAARIGVRPQELPEHVKPAFVKVAEYQARGLVHLHAVIRLDAPTEELAAPDSRFTVAVLTSAVRAAAGRVRFPTPTLGRKPGLWLRFGDQLDIRPIQSGNPQDATSARAVAGYIGKYVTKATGATGAGDTRITNREQLRHLNTSDHYARLVRVAWALGRLPDLRGLRRWAHMLAFGGHVLTKSRRYSTTLGALRRARVEHRQAQTYPGGQLDPWDRELTEDLVLIHRHWRYAGTGYRTTAEAWLAELSATQARAHGRGAA